VVENLVKKNPPEHPIADALCDALHSAKLDPDLLRSVIDWRIKDLSTKQPETVQDLEKYAQGTQGALQRYGLGVHTCSYASHLDLESFSLSPLGTLILVIQGLVCRVTLDDLATRVMLDDLVILHDCLARMRVSRHAPLPPPPLSLSHKRTDWH
jgi:hypothetical protein